MKLSWLLSIGSAVAIWLLLRDRERAAAPVKGSVSAEDAVHQLQEAWADHHTRA